MIATPAGSAQAVSDRLVSAGVTSILNFAPIVLTVPEGVDLRKVDLSIELQILAFHEQRRSGRRREAGGTPGPRDAGCGPGLGGEQVSVLVVGLTHKCAPVATMERVAATGMRSPSCSRCRR